MIHTYVAAKLRFKKKQNTIFKNLADDNIFLNKTLNLYIK